MGIFDNFKRHFISEEDKINQTHLRNLFLISIVGCEERINNEDYKYIENKGVELNLSKPLIYEVFNSSATLKIHKPNSSDQRNQNICEYILFAKRNGQITPDVKEICKRIVVSITSIYPHKGEEVINEIIEIVLNDENNALGINPMTYIDIGRVIGMQYLNVLLNNKL